MGMTPFIIESDGSNIVKQFTTLCNLTTVGNLSSEFKEIVGRMNYNGLFKINRKQNGLADV